MFHGKTLYLYGKTWNKTSLYNKTLTTTNNINNK